MPSFQAWVASLNALLGGRYPSKLNYSVGTCATVTDPEVARVGLSETETKKKKIPY